MTLSVDDIQHALCRSFCADVDVRLRSDGFLQVSTPFVGRDGDSYTLFISQVAGGVTITDRGTTLMRLSYENELSSLMSGARGELFQQIVAESGSVLCDGAIMVTVPTDRIGDGLFRLSQTLIRVSDLALWTKARTKSTFYEDLQQNLGVIQAASGYVKDYVVPGVQDGEDYPVDYYIPGGRNPLYLFGVPDMAKARLTTIVLLHLQNAGHMFDSLVVLPGQHSIPNRDFSRLMAAANDIVPAVSDVGSIERKIAHRLAA